MNMKQGLSLGTAEEAGLFLVKAPGGAKEVSTLINSRNFVPKEF